MSTRKVMSGEVIDYVNTGGALAVNGVRVVGNQVCVALVDIAVGATGSMARYGVYRLPKTSGAGTAIVQGAELMWRASTATFVRRSGATPAAGDVTACCVAAKAAADNDTTVDVILNVGVGVVA